MKGRVSEYTKSQDGDTAVFEVIPASVPRFTYLLIVAAVMGVIGLASIASGFGIVFLGMAAFAAWYALKRDLRPKEHRRAARFRVTPTAIEAAGRTFAKDDVHRLILKNGITDQELSGVEVRTSNPNVAAGVGYRAQVARVAHSLNVETGGKSYLVAGGMDETTAYGLLHDVSKVLGYNVA